MGQTTCCQMMNALERTANWSQSIFSTFRLFKHVGGEQMVGKIAELIVYNDWLTVDFVTVIKVDTDVTSNPKRVLFVVPIGRNWTTLLMRKLDSRKVGCMSCFISLMFWCFPRPAPPHVTGYRRVFILNFISSLSVY